MMMAGQAVADAIDGDWCHAADGRRFSIRGKEIVTPGGRRIDGDYQRHFFSYEVPAGEPAAGQTVQMSLYNENIVHLRVGDATGSASAEVWDRCSPTTSMRTPPKAAPPMPSARLALSR
jgi:hypothetical protein